MNEKFKNVPMTKIHTTFSGVIVVGLAWVIDTLLSLLIFLSNTEVQN